MFVGVRFPSHCAGRVVRYAVERASRRQRLAVASTASTASRRERESYALTTALASTPSHAMIQNEDAHPPRAQAHAARAGSDQG